MPRHPNLNGAQTARLKENDMHYHTVGRTGINVSAYGLGAMMFGAVGNPDHEDRSIVDPPSHRRRRACPDPADDPAHPGRSDLRRPEPPASPRRRSALNA